MSKPKIVGTFYTSFILKNIADVVFLHNALNEPRAMCFSKFQSDLLEKIKEIKTHVPHPQTQDYLIICVSRVVNF